MKHIKRDSSQHKDTLDSIKDNNEAGDAEKDEIS